jgi:hypothetical protein
MYAHICIHREREGLRVCTCANYMCVYCYGLHNYKKVNLVSILDYSGLGFV